jgi:ABC-type multidrug transport system permease subunit
MGCGLSEAYGLSPLGDAYMDASFEYKKSHLWRNLGIILVFWAGFIVLQIFAMEKFQ